MGEHLTSDGRFLSDKYRVEHRRRHRPSTKENVPKPCNSQCSINKMVLSFNDPKASPALRFYADLVAPHDQELADDIRAACDAAYERWNTEEARG